MEDEEKKQKARRKNKLLSYMRSLEKSGREVMAKSQVSDIFIGSKTEVSIS